MKITRHITALTAVVLAMLACLPAETSAQEPATSGAVMRRGSGSRDRNASASGPTGVSERLAARMEQDEVSDADMQWMRVIYRQIDLTKDANTPLYFPDEPVPGQESLFRIIMRLLANNEIAAYEYLDGREVFTDDYRLKVRDILDRFHIYYSEGKGSTEKSPKFEIDDSDVPATEVLNYYVVEKWEFDRVSNRMRTRIEAICPVLSREGDFGGEAVKYPMFWLRMDDLRPYLTTQNIFTDDDNNLATCTYADYFQLGLYEGDIYKTRNLRNRSLMQIHQDPEALKHAQDSIQHRLTTFEDKLWVPTPEQIRERREAAELAAAQAEEARLAAEAGEEGVEAGAAPAEDKPKTTRTRRGSSKSSAKPAKSSSKRAKASKPKSSSSGSSGSSSATKSVRNRKKR